MVVWHDQWRASLPLADEPLASPSAEVPAPPSGEAPIIPPPPLKVHREYVIEDSPVVRIEVSDESGDDVEQVDNLDGVLDHQEE